MFFASANTVVPDAHNNGIIIGNKLGARGPIFIFSADCNFSFSFTGRSTVYGLLMVAPPCDEIKVFILQKFQILTNCYGRNIQFLAKLQYIDKAFLRQFIEYELMAFGL